MALSRLGRPSPFSGVCGAFQDDVTLFDRLQNVVGDGFHLGRSVLDRQSLDGPKLHVPGRNPVSKQAIENSSRLRTDRRADAVSLNRAYDDRADLGVVDPVVFLFQALDPFKLLLEDPAKALLGRLDCFYRGHCRLLWSEVEGYREAFICLQGLRRQTHGTGPRRWKGAESTERLLVVVIVRCSGGVFQGNQPCCGAFSPNADSLGGTGWIRERRSTTHELARLGVQVSLIRESALPAPHSLQVPQLLPQLTEPAP